MTPKSDAKFKEKLASSFKHDIRNLENFDPTIQKSENCFLSKVQRFELKKYRGVIFHDTEKWCKVWINLDLVVSKPAEGIGWTFIKADKSLKREWYIFSGNLSSGTDLAINFDLVKCMTKINIPKL